MIGETVLVNGEPVENVLVEPGYVKDAAEVSLPVGTVVDYTLRFPTAFEGPLSDAKVTVRGKELDTVCHADHLRPADVFGSWSGAHDMTVHVGRVMGDYSATASIVVVSSTLDALGDPVQSESTVYSGPVQARTSYGTEERGSSELAYPSETWHFVVPWHQAFASLRPQSTFVDYGGARYDVSRIVNVDGKSETASFEAVRRG